MEEFFFSDSEQPSSIDFKPALGSYNFYYDKLSHIFQYISKKKFRPEPLLDAEAKPGRAFLRLQEPAQQVPARTLQNLPKSTRFHRSKPKKSVSRPTLPTSSWSRIAITSKKKPIASTKCVTNYKNKSNFDLEKSVSRAMPILQR